MNPLAMMLLAAIKNPDEMGPALDALGPQFSPDAIIPLVQQTSMGGSPGMFAPLAPNAQATATPTPVAPPAAPMMPPDPSTFMPSPAGAAPPYAGANALQRQQQMPVVKAPEAQKPIMSGGVAGAQKAPDFGGPQGVQATPAHQFLQIAMQLANQNQRLPSLGALLGGAV